MNILFVLENYYPRIGGVETLFKSLTDALVAEGHRCTVITSWPGGEISRRESHQGIEIIRIRTFNRYLFTILAVFPVISRLRDCDLLHTTSYNAALPAFIATRIIKRKLLITFHEVWGKLWFRLPKISPAGSWSHYLFEQFLLRLPFDKFVAVSKFTASRLVDSGIVPGKISVIYPGIDNRQFRVEDVAGPESESSHFVYTYFGRLGYSKGLDLLLSAAITVKKQLPESKLKLIIPKKPGHLYAWVLGLIKEYALTGYVEIKSHLPSERLKEEIVASDCIVIPSYSEGFCFVAAESIALGTPVISSGKAALKEVIGGRYIEMSSFDAAALAEAILSASRGEWQEKPVKRFPLDVTVKKYLECYRDLLLETRD